MAGNHNSGRKPKSQNKAETERILVEGSIPGAQYLRSVADGTEKKPRALRVQVCQYLVDQTVGKATQKQEVQLSGDAKNPVYIAEVQIGDSDAGKPFKETA